MPLKTLAKFNHLIMAAHGIGSVPPKEPTGIECPFCGNEMDWHCPYLSVSPSASSAHCWPVSKIYCPRCGKEEFAVDPAGYWSTPMEVIK